MKLTATAIANYLRSERPLTRADRDCIADFIENKVKRPVGRPRGERGPHVLPVNIDRKTLAVSYATWLLFRLRRKYGKKHTVTLRDGKTYNIRKEAIRRAVARHNARRGDSFGTVTIEEITERLRRPKNRRL